MARVATRERTNLVPWPRDRAGAALLLAATCSSNMPRFFDAFAKVCSTRTMCQAPTGELAEFRRWKQTDELSDWIKLLGAGLLNGTNITALCSIRSFPGAILLARRPRTRPLAEPQPLRCSAPCLSGLNDPIGSAVARRKTGGSQQRARLGARTRPAGHRADQADLTSQGVLRARSGASVPRGGMRAGGGPRARRLHFPRNEHNDLSPVSSRRRLVHRRRAG